MLGNFLRYAVSALYRQGVDIAPSTAFVIVIACRSQRSSVTGSGSRSAALFCAALISLLNTLCSSSSDEKSV